MEYLRARASSLRRWGIFTDEELSSTIATRYKRGLIAFHAKGTGVPYCPLTTIGVLDVALDAQSSSISPASVSCMPAAPSSKAIRYTSSCTCPPAPSDKGPQSVIELEGPDGTIRYAARLVIDTMGSVSPIAMALNNGLPFDGVCPTAGTILEGLEGDRTTGDVLVSVAPMQDGAS